MTQIVDLPDPEQLALRILRRERAAIASGLNLLDNKLADEDALKAIDKDYKNNSNIKWNFTKFLISRDGRILGRFEPTMSMKDVKKAIEAAL